MLHLKNKLCPLTKLKNFWESMDQALIVNQRELVLGLTTCVLSGMVIGMFCSPKKQVTIGSHNGSNNCDNVNNGSLQSEADQEDAADAAEE